MPDVSFFRKNKQYLQLEWNAASGFDWPKIRQLFVAAYVSAYKDVPLEQLDLNPQVVSYAREKNQIPWWNISNIALMMNLRRLKHKTILINIK